MYQIGSLQCKLSEMAVATNVKLSGAILERSLDVCQQDGFVFIHPDCRRTFGIGTPIGFSNEKNEVYVGVIPGQIDSKSFLNLTTESGRTDKLELTDALNLGDRDIVDFFFEGSKLMAKKNKGAAVRLMDLKSMWNDFSLFIQLGGSTRRLHLWSGPADKLADEDDMKKQLADPALSASTPAPLSSNRAEAQDPKKYKCVESCGREFNFQCCQEAICLCKQICESCAANMKFELEMKIERMAFDLHQKIKVLTRAFEHDTRNIVKERFVVKKS